MILEIIFISILGTLFHFTYDWSKHNKFVALFSAVNESTWEHIKIAISALFIVSLIDGLFLGTNPNYFIGKFLSLLALMIVIPLIFYSYKFFTKKPILIVDILSFYVAIIISQIVFYYLINLDALSFKYSYLSMIGIFLIFGFYMIMTLVPLKNFLFKDPITNKYGIKAHK